MTTAGTMAVTDHENYGDCIFRCPHPKAQSLMNDRQRRGNARVRSQKRERKRYSEREREKNNKDKRMSNKIQKVIFAKKDTPTMSQGEAI